jgi:hypothetical protein
MSEFKFSCPNCQQSIAATSEYSGVQINCPSCQKPLVVPHAPGAASSIATPTPPGAPPPPPVPAHTKLTMAASTGHTAAGTQSGFTAPPVRKKKNRTSLYVRLAASACAIVGLIAFWGPISDFGKSTYAKISPHVTAPAPQAPTNEPPPPPPDLMTSEILQNVADTYKGLTDYAVKGQFLAAITTTGANGAQILQNSTEGVSLELGRTNLYRVEWLLQSTGTPYKGAAWSAGKGDYIEYGPYPAAKTKNRQTALATAFANSSAQCITLAQLFFDDTNSIARLADAFAKTNGPGLNTHVNKRDCYVLDGQFPAHDLVVWVDKETFLIPQIQFIFGGKLDESTLKAMPAALKTQLTTWEKLKGSITETYQPAATNKNLVASVFEAAFTPTIGPAAAQGQEAPRMRQPRGTSPTSPTQLTRRVREANGNAPPQ